MSTEVFKIVICHLPFVKETKVFDKSFKGAKCVSITIVSSYIYESLG